MRIKNLDFDKTCGECPEQYEVFFNDKPAGYIRLRYGKLTVDYPECLGERLYSANIGGEWTGKFQDNEQRMYYLNKIADIILDRIKNN